MTEQAASHAAEEVEPARPVFLAPAGNGAAHLTAESVIAALRKRLGEADAGWKRALLEAIAAWPLANEAVDGERLDYLIGSEAFDWPLLAARLGRAIDSAIPEGALDAWLSDPDPTGGFAEAEFTRLLGVDKYRSHLNYLYGVTVEKALVAAVEQEITKRRVASGQPPTERARDEAYERLYEGRQEALWAEFRAEDNNSARGRHGPKRDQLSLGDVDAFTYWLFKRRMKRSDPARVASDTRKGLTQYERMRQAHERRLQGLHAGKTIDTGGQREAQKPAPPVARSLRRPRRQRPEAPDS